MRPYLEKAHHKQRAGGVAQAIRAHEALSSNPSTAKKKKKFSAKPLSVQHCPLWEFLLLHLLKEIYIFKLWLKYSLRFIILTISRYRVQCS
jgi:hypothetical protein